MPGSTVADCGIFVVDSAGLIASWNPGAERLTGFTAADVVGRPAAVLGAELGAGAPRAPHDAPPSPDCSASDREAVVRRKDGSTFRASVATSAFEMNAGRANAVAIREVSDERTSQEALRKTATLLRAVAEGTTDLVFVKDLAGRYLLLNEAARSAAGRPMDEILGRTDAELLDPQNAKRVMGRDRHVVETGRAETEEEEAVVGGVPRVYLTTKAPCRDDGGKVVGVIGIARDITDRKRVEEALADRERKLAEAQRIAHLGHWERDLQTGRVTWSEETYRVFGMAPGGPAPELPALVEKVHPDDRRLMEDAIARALRGGPSYDLQYRVLRPNGDIRFVHSHCEVKRDASGAPCALFGVVQDVTDRKRVEEALEESEERHRLALDVAALGTWRHDLLTGVAYLDARTQEVWSFDHAEVRWEDLVARVHPDDREGLTTKRTASCNPGSDGDYANEFRIVRPDGDVRWLAARARIFFEGEGPARRPTLAIGTTADVTDRRRADEAIRRSEELLRRAEAMANVAAWTFDIASGTFTYSDQAARICGRRPGPHRIDDWLSAVHPQDRERLQLALQKTLAGAPLELEHRLVVDGNIKWVYVRAEPQLDAAGRVVGLIGVGQDVTERRQIEEQLRQAQKLEAMGRLAGGVAHDFNNLISGISMYGELLLDGLPRHDRLRTYVSAIQTATQLGARLTAQLLAFSRKAVVAPELLDLNEVIESISLMLGRLVSEDVALVTALCPAPGRVMLDRGQLEQVLMNLAVNARDAMPNGGRLTLETREVEVQQQPARETEPAPGRYVELTVSDTGHGMTDEVKSHIFEPFFTTKGAGKGTGLGLATVFGIVKQAGGHIFVDSWVDEGTRFRILLPVVPQTPPAAAPRSAQTEPPPGKETVLLAEDEAVVRSSARLVLETQGYEVIEAATGAEAVRAVEAYPGTIHLLLTDVVMPGMCGRELAQAVLARRPNVKVLYMSGYLDDEVVRHGVLQSTDAFLQKPLTRLAMARKIREVLDGER